MGWKTQIHTTKERQMVIPYITEDRLNNGSFETNLNFNQHQTTHSLTRKSARHRAATTKYLNLC